MNGFSRPIRAFLAALLAAGCFYTPPNPPVDFQGLNDGSDPCVTGGGMFVGGRTVRVGLAHPVDQAHAPIPWNPSEAFAFGALYETLLNVDCRGRVAAGLATIWRASADGRRWTFTLAADRNFWNGDAVTAGAVVAALMANADSDAPGIRPRLAGVVFSAPDDSTVVVDLPSPVAAVSLFADPVFAVAQVNGGRVGSGPYELAGAGRLISRLDELPDVVLRVGPDARDLIDGGVDVLVTADAAVVDYARSRRDFGAFPLRWSTQYLLFADDGFPTLPVEATWRRRLATDVVRADARPADSDSWWEALRFCPVAPPLADRSAPAGRQTVLYPEDDPAARDLAQRIAAATGRPSRAVPWAEAEGAIRAGASAVVFPVPINFAAPCLLSAEWLDAFRRYRIDPLVEVRFQLVKAFLGPGAYASYRGGIEFRPPQRGVLR